MSDGLSRINWMEVQLAANRRRLRQASPRRSTTGWCFRWLAHGPKAVAQAGGFHRNTPTIDPQSTETQDYGTWESGNQIIIRAKEKSRKPLLLLGFRDLGEHFHLTKIILWRTYTSYLMREYISFYLYFFSPTPFRAFSVSKRYHAWYYKTLIGYLLMIL